MNLILLEPDEASDPSEVVLADARGAHLRDVLKVAPGQTVRVGIVDGPIGTGTVAALNRGAVTLACTFGETPERPRVDLLLALPRPKVMRRLWAQLAALGVGRVMLTNAARVERNYFDTHVLTPECYRPLLIEGLQQSRDTRLPLVSVHRQLKVLIEDELPGLANGTPRAFADPGSNRSLRDVVRQGPGTRMLLAVGPEGGWNDFERSLLTAHGFAAVSMGRRVLRSDTAVIALLALSHDAFL